MARCPEYGPIIPDPISPSPSLPACRLYETEQSVGSPATQAVALSAAIRPSFTSSRCGHSPQPCNQMRP